MPCGCRGKNAQLPINRPEPAQTKSVGRVAVYEVVKDSEPVLTTTNPKAARQEANRLGATVRVTSRAVEAGDPVPA